MLKKICAIALLSIAVTAFGGELPRLQIGNAANGAPVNVLQYEAMKLAFSGEYQVAMQHLPRINDVSDQQSKPNRRRRKKHIAKNHNAQKRYLSLCDPHKPTQGTSRRSLFLHCFLNLRQSAFQYKLK